MEQPNNGTIVSRRTDETGFGIFLVEAVGNDVPSPPALHATTTAFLARGLHPGGQMAEPHRHDEHEINLVITGSAQYRCADSTIAMSAGQILVIPGGTRHLLEVESHVVFMGIFLHPRVVLRCLRQTSADPIATVLAQVDHPAAPRAFIEPIYYQTLHEHFEHAMVEHGQTDRWSAITLGAIAKQVAVILLRLMQLPDNRYLHEDATALRVLTVKAWMDRHFLQGISLNELADMANLSPSHFSSLFRQLTHTSPKAYLQDRRLTHAANLLLATETPVQEIAARLGFEQPAHFIRLFKAHFQLTPGLYRKKRQSDQHKG